MHAINRYCLVLLGYQGLSINTWEKNILIVPLYIWNLCLLWAWQKVTQEFPFKRHKDPSVSSNVFASHRVHNYNSIMSKISLLHFRTSLFCHIWQNLCFVLQDQRKRSSCSLFQHRDHWLFRSQCCFLLYSRWLQPSSASPERSIVKSGSKQQITNIF